ncbi:dihydropteridine reductase [Nilaparvata lugens]|uniref:dihydropteridine reductase n=1 Tax=Nilaparvata lugens TaxID=108931 RepID=UPI000B97F051|nr:dihydropteridine reductase [Nilaparvata lugens]
MSSSLGRVLIYGGKGALGAACVKHFKTQNWWVGCIDMKENEQADANIVVQVEDDWLQQESKVLSQLQSVLTGDKVDAVICVAGGWAGGNAASKEFVKNSDMMWKQSVWSSVIAASIASNYLKEGGLVSLPGAKPALGPTPGMIGYGMAKAAVHQLTKSLAGENSGLPANSLSVAILPVTLDTPMNRKWMPDADKSTWTPLEFVADLFYRWSKGEDRPPNGSLVHLVTKNNVTDLVFV